MKSEKELTMPHKLYVFVNTDLKSMTPGKAMAHSGHAANHAAHIMNMGVNGKRLIEEWGDELGFGTQINVYAPWAEVRTLIYQHINRHYCGLVTDPSYPFEADTELAKYLPSDITPIYKGNGRSIFFRKQETAAWVFVADGCDITLASIMAAYPLAQ